jgi:hypothetical protein
MPAMKVTSNAAMRARDVSRPHARHVVWAEEAEARVVAVAAEAGGCLAEAPPGEMAAVPTEVDIPDPGSSGSEVRRRDAEADADRTDGRADSTRRRRVRGFRSSTRRGRLPR